MKPGMENGVWALLGLIGLSVLLACSPARPADNPSLRPLTVVAPIPASLRDCLPKRLHPVSLKILEAWLAGKIETHLFRRFFHLPNSDYLPVGACLVKARASLIGDRKGNVRLVLYFRGMALTTGSAPAMIKRL